MNIFFDVDFTILSVDAGLRRGTHQVFERLAEDGHDIYLWSGKGARWSVVRKHRLAPFLSGVFAKPLEDFDAALEWLRVTPAPDFVVDDYGEIVCHFGGYHIPEFLYSRDDDDELETVYEVVSDLTAAGRTSHPRWKPRRTGQPADPGALPSSVARATRQLGRAEQP
jgi:hypothetical protein